MQLRERKRPVVLIVEDEVLVRIDTREMVEAAGFEVVEAGNADEAIAILAARDDIHLIFTDVHMTPEELDSAFAVIRRLLRPAGRLVLGDILRPEVGMAQDVLALLKFAKTHGFLKDALYGLASTALSDYRQLRSRVGLQRYGEDEMIRKLAAAGFSASRARSNIGHNPWRMTFVARHALVRGAEQNG